MEALPQLLGGFLLFFLGIWLFIKFASWIKLPYEEDYKSDKKLTINFYLLTNMEQLIPAQEAHRRADAVREARVAQEIEEVTSAINKAWDEGLYKVSINKRLTKVTKQYLIEHGYKVSYYAGSQLDPEGFTNITF